MSASKIASVAAVLGGLGWLTKVALIWANGGTNTDTGLVAVMFFVGVVGLVLAVAAAGYALVPTAPIWLRVVVVVALPVMVLTVWQMLDTMIKAIYTEETWVRGETTLVLAAVIALALGLFGLSRRRPGNGTRVEHRSGGRRIAR